MRNTYKRILTFIGFLIIACIFIGIAYLFYDKVINHETEVEVIGELSINYIDGIKIKGESAYNFSITNNGTNDIYYEILIDNLKNYESKVNYNLTSREASLEVINENIDPNTNILATNILISKGSTQNFQLKLNNNDITSFNLKIKKTVDSKEYFYATILKNNEIKKSPIDLAHPSTTNEGLISDFDDSGVTYYFRGNVSNNYVSFADNLWRIVRINGDGTVKLVLNDIIDELSSYNDTLENYEEFPSTSVLKTLNAYYDTYLKDYDNYIAGYKFCTDTLSNNNTDKVYNAYNRLATDHIPTFNCLGSSFNNKIGLLSADEVIYAGGSITEANSNYYLYNSEIDNIWWTSSLAKASTTEFTPFAVNEKGAVVANISGLTIKALRPTINLDHKVTVTGDGTKDNPYMPS